MSYRTILVHLGFDRLSKARLEFAAELANAHGAALLGCYAATWADVWFRKGQVNSLAQANAALEDHVRQTESDFNALCAGRKLAGSFVHKDKWKLDGLVESALLADLCVLSIAGPIAPDEGFLFESAPEGLIMATSCPVLLLPETPPVSFGRNVLVAWKPRREAARAIRDALPILKKAQSVSVLTVGPDVEDWPAHDIYPFLSAHGIESSTIQNPSSDSNAGEVILTQARLLKCDTIVMGAYGHSRVREFFLGGATRHVLKHSTIPILMSH